MAEGWCYGLRRDEEEKTHPSLVPYDELPEPEKEYDRSTAMETLKVLLALGYRIEKAP
jgi:ryanodine receptor 2